jgi:hypothetical protein
LFAHPVASRREIARVVISARIRILNRADGS